MTDDEVTEIATRTTREAMDELCQICEAVAEKHHIADVRLSQPDTQRIGLYLYEVQEQSFTLGVRKGLQMVMEYMEAHPEPEPPKEH